MTAATIRPADVLAMGRGSRIAELLPDLELELGKQEALVRKRVFAALERQELSNQDAWNAWAEIHAMHQLKRRLDKAVKEAQSIGQNLQQEIDDGEGTESS